MTSWSIQVGMMHATYATAPATAWCDMLSKCLLQPSVALCYCLLQPPASHLVWPHDQLLDCVRATGHGRSAHPRKLQLQGPAQRGTVQHRKLRPTLNLTPAHTRQAGGEIRHTACRGGGQAHGMQGGRSGTRQAGREIRHTACRGGDQAHGRQGSQTSGQDKESHS